MHPAPSNRQYAFFSCGKGYDAPKEWLSSGRICAKGIVSMNAGLLFLRSLLENLYNIY
jgi:hypothetical protein